MKTNKYEIAAKLAIAELENFHGKMNAEQQRQVFGQAFFGRKTIQINCAGQGTVDVWYSAAYGTDTTWTQVTFKQIADAVNGNYKLSL